MGNSAAFQSGLPFLLKELGYIKVVRMVEKLKGNDPISERPPTAIRSAMVESPVL